MNWFDSLIPAGLWDRGVTELHEDFNGFPGLTSFLLLLLVVGLIMLAVSIDSMVIRRGSAIGRAALAAA